MRKIILFMHMSLDGFIAGPNGELDWATKTDDVMGKYLITDLLNTTDTILVGRVLYQGFEQAWPAMASNPNSPKDLVDFAHWMEDTPKIVFSNTLEKVEWKNSKLIHVKDDNDITKEITRLKQEPGGDMVLFGGVKFAQTLVRLELVDEYRFKLEPVVLGSGKSLFQYVKGKMKLKLAKSKVFDPVVTLYYKSGN